MLNDKDYTFYLHGKSPDERREHRGGFAVKNSLLGSIIPPVGGTKRNLVKLQLQTSVGPVSLISAYAPTRTPLSDAKDRFYDELSTVINEVSRQEPLFVLGWFQRQSWRRPQLLAVLSRSPRHWEANGQRLLELCCQHNLCITNTYFKTKPQHRVSWRHPKSKHWHRPDLATTRRSSFNSVQLTCRVQTATQTTPPCAAR